MNIKTFTEFWKGMFFFVSTVAVSFLLYLVVVEWQPLWTEGFRNFGDISRAISRLDRTAKPIGEMAPLILGEMDKMQNTMVKMQQSMETIEAVNPNIREMTHSMKHMTWVMDQNMGEMTHEMGQIEDRFSPSGIMPFNW